MDDFKKRATRRLGTEFRRVSAAVRRQFVRLGGLSSALYYRLVGPEFGHEFRVVGAGVAEYDRRELSDRDVFHLRRNIHMIEKGLIMKPRRDTFAVGYIGATVSLYAKTEGSSLLSEEEEKWVSHVLDEYFEATQASTDAKIAKARDRFAGTSRPVDERTHSPFRADRSGDGLVSIDALSALAEVRRSVRWYRPDSVPRDVIDRALNVGMQAPTACNRQPYKFLVIEDEGLRKTVARIPMGTGGFAHQIPGLMVLVGDQSAFFSERDRHLIYIDGCLAASAVILALQAQGIASCVINWPDIPEREREMRRALKLAAHEQVVMLIAFGYEDMAERAPYSAKKSLESARIYL